MAVRKRGGQWQADIQVKGARHRASFSNETAANAWILEVKAALANGRQVPQPGAAGSNRPVAGGITLADACERCFETEWSRNTSGWAETVRGRLGHIKELLGPNRPLSTIDVEALVALRNQLIDSGSAPGTVNQKMTCLNRVLRWAYDREYIAKVPKVCRLKEPPGRLRYFTPDEEANQLRLLEQFGKRAELDFVKILYDTGMRHGEVFKMRGDDIRLEQCSIMIPDTKTNLPRMIYGTKRVMEILERRMLMFGSGKLFPDTNQRQLQRAWNRVRDVLGESDDPEYVMYTCRHTCASRMVQRGIEIGVVSRWLGHTNIQMTMRYAKFAPKNFEHARSVLEPNYSAAELPRTSDARVTAV